MNKLKLILFFLLLGHFVSAQDLIITVSSDTILSKVVLVGTKKIEYLKYEALEGPKYEIRRKEVSSIVYVDGRVDTFNVARNLIKVQSDPLVVHNIARLNLFPLGYGNLSLSYERIFFDGSLGIEYRHNHHFKGVNRSFLHQTLDSAIWSGQISLKYYPIKQRMVTYSVGPSFRFGESKYNGPSAYSGWPYNAAPVDIMYRFYAFSLTQGLRFTQDHLGVFFNLSTGFLLHDRPIDYYFGDKSKPEDIWQNSHRYVSGAGGVFYIF